MIVIDEDMLLLIPLLLDDGDVDDDDDDVADHSTDMCSHPPLPFTPRRPSPARPPGHREDLLPQVSALGARRTH
jgi:hypothetical protein